MQVGPSPSYGQQPRPDIYVNPQNQPPYSPEGPQHAPQKGPPQGPPQYQQQYSQPYGQVTRTTIWSVAHSSRSAIRPTVRSSSRTPSFRSNTSSEPPTPPRYQYQPGQLGQPPPPPGNFTPDPNQPTDQFEGAPHKVRAVRPSATGGRCGYRYRL